MTAAAIRAQSERDEKGMVTQDISQAIRLQWRVILALMLREARTRYGRQKIGYLWALVEPILHIVALYFLFQFRGRVLPFGDSLLIFLATGITTYLGFRNIMTRTQGAYSSNEALLSFPAVKVIDVFLGRAILELATWVLVSFLILSTLITLDLGPLPRSIMMMMGAMLLLFCLALGLGIFLGILTQFLPAVGNLLSVPMRLLYFTSGVFFLPESFPPAVRDVLYWNPVMHGIALYREGYYPNYNSNLLDVPYLMVWAICSLFLGLVSERVARKALRSAI